MLLRTKLFGKTYEFRDIRELMGKANEEKSGDRLAGVAAASAVERVAAKYVLSEVRLEVLRANPAVPYEQDEVTRVIDDRTREILRQIPPEERLKLAMRIQQMIGLFFDDTA